MMRLVVLNVAYISVQNYIMLTSVGGYFYAHTYNMLQNKNLIP